MTSMSIARISNALQLLIYPFCLACVWCIQNRQYLFHNSKAKQQAQHADMPSVKSVPATGRQSVSQSACHCVLCMYQRVCVCQRLYVLESVCAFYSTSACTCINYIKSKSVCLCGIGLSVYVSVCVVDLRVCACVSVCECLYILLFMNMALPDTLQQKATNFLYTTVHYEHMSISLSLSLTPYILLCPSLRLPACVCVFLYEYGRL